MVSIIDKLTSVICSCKTHGQLNVAHNYLKLARKGQLINIETYYFLYGTLNAIKGMCDAKELAK